MISMISILGDLTIWYYLMVGNGPDFHDLMMDGNMERNFGLAFPGLRDVSWSGSHGEGGWLLYGNGR